MATSNTNYDLRLQLDTRVSTSFPSDITYNNNGTIDDVTVRDISTSEYMLNFSNLGFGIDVGFTYQLNEKTNISASLLDLGFISWRKDVNTFASEGNIAYAGTGVGTDFDNPEYLSDLRDSLKNMFTPVGGEHKYMSTLMTNL